MKRCGETVEEERRHVRGRMREKTGSIDEERYRKQAKVWEVRVDGIAVN